MIHSLSHTYAPGSVYGALYPFSASNGHAFQNTALSDGPLTLNPVFTDPPLTIAGRNVDIISFASAHGRDTRRCLRECFGTPYADERQLRLIPSLTSAEHGRLDAHIVDHLRFLTRDRALLLSQPFFDQALQSRYQIDPTISHWLNDKRSLMAYVPAEFLPERLATYRNGEECRKDPRRFCPCVVKIASSSSGDGVRIVRTPTDLDAAREAFRDWTDAVLIEEYLPFGRNIGVQFSIPADKEKPPELIGVARQIVDESGHFLGNRIEEDYAVPGPIARVFINTILPRIRALGWHGIGGMDVIEIDEKFYCIDPNFRCTAATAHLYHRGNGTVKKPALTFFGSMHRPLRFLEKHARFDDPGQRAYILAAHEDDQGTALIGGVLYENEAELTENIRVLRAEGVSSDAFAAQESVSHPNT